MSDRIRVGTRKGLFTVERTSGSTAGWRITDVDFLGDNVSIAFSDSRDASR